MAFRRSSTTRGVLSTLAGLGLLGGTALTTWLGGARSLGAQVPGWVIPGRTEDERKEGEGGKEASPPKFPPDGILLLNGSPVRILSTCEVVACHLL